MLRTSSLSPSSGATDNGLAGGAMGGTGETLAGDATVATAGVPEDLPPSTCFSLEGLGVVLSNCVSTGFASSNWLEDSGKRWRSGNIGTWETGTPAQYVPFCWAVWIDP